MSLKRECCGVFSEWIAHLIIRQGDDASGLHRPALSRLHYKWTLFLQFNFRFVIWLHLDHFVEFLKGRKGIKLSDYSNGRIPLEHTVVFHVNRVHFCKRKELSNGSHSITVSESKGRVIQRPSSLSKVLSVHKWQSIDDAFKKDALIKGW